MEDSQDLSEQSVSTKAAKVNGKKKKRMLFNLCMEGFYFRFENYSEV